MKYRVNHEYIDQVLGRRVYPGEILELSAERVRAINSLGVGLDLIRDEPLDVASIAPPERAGGGKRGRKNGS